jgi:hypothetical protein
MCLTFEIRKVEYGPVRHWHLLQLFFLYELQKNPTAVRTPEEDKGLEEYMLNHVVNVDKFAMLSHHLNNICHDAVDSTYMKDTDLAQGLTCLMIIILFSSPEHTLLRGKLL